LPNIPLLSLWGRRWGEGFSFIIMAKFNKQQVLAKITETGMVPVFYNNDVEIAKNIVKACYDGGVRAFEFTNRGDFAHEVFAEVVKFAAKECHTSAHRPALPVPRRWLH
jgi:hypothetical protein